MPPQEKMEPALQQFRSRIAEAAVGKMPLRIRGGGSKDWYGQNLQGSLLDTRAYSGIVAYDQIGRASCRERV